MVQNIIQTKTIIVYRAWATWIDIFFCCFERKINIDIIMFDAKYYLIHLKNFAFLMELHQWNYYNVWCKILFFFLQVDPFIVYGDETRLEVTIKIKN